MLNEVLRLTRGDFSNFKEEDKEYQKLHLKLEEEFKELNERIVKLKTFLDSDMYQKLPDESKSLLFIQYEAMKTYGRCLVARINLIKKREVK